MAADFLSQDEVDALLRGVTGEVEETEADEGDGSGVRDYNLGTQERIVRGRMPTMELINERFARYLRIGLFNYMHRNAEISVGTIKVQKYSEFVRNLVVPTNLNLVTAKPLRGTGLIVFDPNLVFLVVDNMFGGDGRFHTRVEGRDFTATEQRIIMGMLGTVFAEYERAWAPVYKLKLEFLRSEMNSQFANIATPSEIVVSTVFSLELGGAQADMHICFPYSMLEPIRETLYSTMQSDHITQDKRWIGTMTKQLKTAEVKLTCNLGHATVSLRDIVNMRVGDVIPLDVEETIRACVDNVPVLEGHYGVHNGQYAIKVERMIAADDNSDTSPSGARNG
ncbi:flagellar motor switch protein FliM [Denitromonas ohlonensis]|jgi:flagellar motor switch protein FliM|uniref:Flagellar motor switch protein FliM n=2 Tax=Denitromonas TaxID=139331 RepID=A0A557S8I4_9RHOO|nr:flagellar motor switch protein FliM [Denitromonas ohlonensis]TVT48138.1 MAG: flagellar motor switch protein FliM [Denitromonas halophila]TVO63054.1 flagellar motor switch protein FliM [Denitromonas ohlonensis]TVO73694.1 flagellar motor switch protein FliM [Denitromonas ohlonensis]TVT68929.1 MAG: flagellar motor switch protein FliM [Denitromonas halophila]TVT76976.1 MAG: flagellar motor switch protein FliM [Denitromonas halophila]